jgi:hypothetical protein
MAQWTLAARSFTDTLTAIAPVMNPIGCALLYPQLSAVRRDNQDGNPATIRMRMRRCWGDEGRA